MRGRVLSACSAVARCECWHATLALIVHYPNLASFSYLHSPLLKAKAVFFTLVLASWHPATSSRPRKIGSPCLSRTMLCVVDHMCALCYLANSYCQYLSSPNAFHITVPNRQQQQQCHLHHVCFPGLCRMLRHSQHVRPPREPAYSKMSTSSQCVRLKSMNHLPIWT